MSWSVYLAARYPRKTMVVIATTLLAAVAGYFALGLLGVIATVVLMTVTFADFLFPMRYELTTESVVCYMLLKRARIKWADVRRVYVDELGVKLSPLDVESRLEAFRGVYLRFADNADEVKEAVRKLRAG